MTDLTQPHEFSYHDTDWGTKYCYCGLPDDNPLHINVNTNSNNVNQDGNKTTQSVDIKTMVANAPSLEETIKICLDTPEFIKEYERLLGQKLVATSPIEKMIDKATGYDEKLAHDFFNFIRDYIWMPVVAKTIMENVRKETSL